ncbi:uncharacterized protein LOC131084064 [Melospiza georgiana]|uniref:uncharacterized protein LOC131084064 n=1 Tax=Melospiza georgiana TaxID=44398 RepID=UPI0025AD4571|nr:uncharacterized protein LOC131084064 [Melospiza georgiana]
MTGNLLLKYLVHCKGKRKNHQTPPIFAKSFGVWAAKGKRPQHQGWWALVLPTLWVSQGWHREWCRCWSGSGAAALWSHFKGCPCWSTLVPAIPWDTEAALSQVALAPWQECGSSPRAAGAPAGKGQEDPCGMRLERASRGAASGWRRAKGPTWCHQGTCEEQNGHLEATWRKGMHIPVFSTPPVGPTCESFPPLVHLQLDPEKLQIPSH